MSIFIPNRAIKLPKDISEVQDITASVKNLQKRDSAFIMGKRFDGSLVDKVTNTKAQCSINGTRYGIVNGVVTPFAANVPPVEDEGLRGCPAFTQLAIKTEALDLWSRTGSITVVSGYITKSDSLDGWISIEVPIPPQNTTGLSFFASIELIGTGSVGINMTVAGGASPVVDVTDTITGQYFPVVTLHPTMPTKMLVRCVIQESDRTCIGMRIRSRNAPFSFKILGRGANITISTTEMPYVPNSSTSSVSVVSEAGTSTTGTSFDLDLATLSILKTGLRGPNAQGHIELEFESNVDSGWLDNGTSVGILSANNNVTSLLYYQKSSDGSTLSFRIYDGSNIALITGVALTVGQTFRISLDYGTYTDGTLKMRLTVNGVKSSVVAFSGSFGTQDLRLFFGNTVHMGWIKKDSLKYYEMPRWWYEGGFGPPGFMPNLKAGDTMKDLVTGTPAVCSIDGTRYGLVNGVVTPFAANQPPIEDDGLRGCPAFTQLAKMTETLTDELWSIANMLSPVPYASFQERAIWDIAESTAPNEIHQISQFSAYATLSDNSVIGISLVTKYKGRKLFLVGHSKDGLYETCRMNLQTGVIEVNNGLAASITAIGDGYYRAFFAFNVNSGGATPFLNIQTDNGTSNQYTGDGVSGIFIGQPTYINFGVNGIPFIPPYVPNNTGSSVSVVSEAATATTGTSFDLDLPALSSLKTGLRGPNAQGHIELEVESNVDSGWLPDGVDTYFPILTCADNNTRGLLFRKQSTDNALVWRVTDMAPTTLTIVQNPFVVGQTFKISLDYGTYTDGSQKMRLTVNGVKSSVAAFSGSWGTQDLRFFYGNTVHAGHIKDLKYFERPQW